MLHFSVIVQPMMMRCVVALNWLKIIISIMFQVQVVKFITKFNQRNTDFFF